MSDPKPEPQNTFKVVASTLIGDTPPENVGSVIGPYKLLQQIGEGGFGVVFMAEQEKPVRRIVALKIIKPGMDTAQVVARFESERQALALMDHPNIAKVLDAGATASGHPYFVMELVKGVPITEFCDANHLPPDARLKLFVDVCHAIQHAHHKGIIHRDIKPSNVMVTLHDGTPIVKVIDFGVAKATVQKLTEKTLFTAYGQMVGTPAYMSPEQAEMSGLDIDTRSDVYSLGVLLYELLTGTTPLESQRLRTLGYAEMQRLIREEDPPRPSTRLSSLGDSATIEADKRGLDVKRLVQLLAGDLDWVVMKALEKDRNRRYGTPGGFAEDVERCLAGEAVLAHPPSRFYRLKKVLRKNKGAVGAVVSAACALMVGLIAFAWQARIARQERDIAIAAKAETKERADELQKVSDFQAQMLGQVDPTAAGLQLSQDIRAKFSSALTKAGVPQPDCEKQVDVFLNQWSRINATDAARELIDSTILKPAVRTIDERFADQPVVAATLRQVLADRYRVLGLLDSALLLQKQALATRRAALGEEHPDTLTSMQSMSLLLMALGKLDEADSLCRETLENRRRVLGNDHPDTLTSIGDLGSLLRAEGKLSEAEAYDREVLEKRRRVLGERNPDTLVSLDNLGLLLRAQGKLDEAKSCLREVLETRRQVLGENHPQTIVSVSSMASLLYDQGDRTAAIPLFREAVEKDRRILGDAHPTTLESISNLGTALSDTGKSDEAEALLREALATQQRLLGADHLSTMISGGNLAVFLAQHGKFAEAEPMCRELLERRRRVLGVNHPHTLVSCNVMGYVLRRQKKQAEAEPYVRQALEIARRVLGEDHQDTFIYVHNLGMLLREQGKLTEAEPYLRDVVERGGRKLGREHRTVLIATINLGGILAEEKRFQSVVALLGPVEQVVRKTLAGDDVWIASLLTNLGKAHSGLHQFILAEAELLEARSLYATTRGPTHKDTLDCVQAAIDLYRAWNAAEPGKGYDKKAEQLRTKSAGTKSSKKSA